MVADQQRSAERVRAGRRPHHERGPHGRHPVRHRRWCERCRRQRAHARRPDPDQQRRLLQRLAQLPGGLDAQVQHRRQLRHRQRVGDGHQPARRALQRAGVEQHLAEFRSQPQLHHAVGAGQRHDRRRLDAHARQLDRRRPRPVWQLDQQRFVQRRQPVRELQGLGRSDRYRRHVVRLRQLEQRRGAHARDRSDRQSDADTHERQDLDRRQHAHDRAQRQHLGRQ